MFHKNQVVNIPSLPKTVQVYIICPSGIVNSISFYASKYPSLDNKLYNHPHINVARAYWLLIV